MFAALREFFKTKVGDRVSNISSGGLTFCHGAQNEEKTETLAHVTEDEKRDEKEMSETTEHGSLLELSDVNDEFFDVPEGSDFDMHNHDWASDSDPETHSQVKGYYLHFLDIQSWGGITSGEVGVVIS